MAHAPSTVVKTIQANVATLGFIQRGLPGQPEGLVSWSHVGRWLVTACRYKVLKMESREGQPLEDMSAPPPDVVYVIGSSE